MFTGDLLSFMALLNDRHVEYMIIGGAAVNIHGLYPHRLNQVIIRNSLWCRHHEI